MNLEKFTERSRGFLQAAQTIAMRESHQRLAPEHLLKALMDDEQGLSSNLIRRAGGEPARVVEAVDAALAKLPKVSGDAQPFTDPGLVKVLVWAGNPAKPGVIRHLQQPLRARDKAMRDLREDRFIADQGLEGRQRRRCNGRRPRPGREAAPGQSGQSEPRHEPLQRQVFPAGHQP